MKFIDITLTSTHKMMSILTLLVLTFVFAPGPIYATSELPDHAITLDDINKQTEFNKAGAEVIKRIVDIEVNENFHEQTTVYLAVKLNNDLAVQDYSQITIPYNSFYGEVELEFANTILPSGERKPADLSVAQIQTPPSPFFYQDRRNLVFSLPLLKPGSVIEYQYRRKTNKPYIDNHWHSRLRFYSWHQVNRQPGYRLDPLREVKYRVSLPKSLPINIKFLKGAKQYNQKKYSSSEMTTYEWTASNIEEFFLEPSTPYVDQIMPNIVLTTLSDWKKIGKWASDLFESKKTESDEVKRIAKDIELNNNSDIEKLKAVYAYLQNNIRYLYAYVGRDGYTPHFPNEILDSAYGDCKDQTMLVVSILKELGITAYPAIIKTEFAGNFDKNHFVPDFDHMIVYLKKPIAGIQWIDTTASKALFPGVFRAIEGREALILDPQNIRFEKIPEKSSEQNKLAFNVDFNEIKENEVSSTITLNFSGAFEEAYRKIWINNKESDTTFRTLLNQVYPNAKIENIKPLNQHNIFEEFYITATAKFKFNKTDQQEPYLFGINPSAVWRTFISPERLISPELRTQPYIVSKGYTMEVAMKVAKPAKNFYAAQQNTPIDTKNNTFDIKHDFIVEEDSATIKTTLTESKKTVLQKNYKGIYDNYHAFVKAPARLISYSQDENSARLSELSSQSGASIKAINDLIQFHIDNGDFEIALKKSNEAISREDVNGRSHFLLGLSQAYLGQDSESEKSFQIAKDKGYQF